MAFLMSLLDALYTQISPFFHPGRNDLQHSVISRNYVFFLVTVLCLESVLSQPHGGLPYHTQIYIQLLIHGAHYVYFSNSSLCVSLLIYSVQKFKIS